MIPSAVMITAFTPFVKQKPPKAVYHTRLASDNREMQKVPNTQRNILSKLLKYNLLIPKNRSTIHNV